METSCDFTSNAMFTYFTLLSHACVVFVCVCVFVCSWCSLETALCVVVSCYHGNQVILLCNLVVYTHTLAFDLIFTIYTVSHYHGNQVIPGV